MIIKAQETKVLNYENFWMLKKTLKAVCEAIRWYPFEIEEVNFKGNGLIGEDIGLLLTALELKFHTIMTLNLFENRIGIWGAEYFAA